jgi:tRNA (guanine10-N2)-dimethyltransferase
VFSGCPHPMAYICVLSTDEFEWEIGQAEFWALSSGVEAAGRTAVLPRPLDVGRAAYVTVCAELLASAPSPESIAEAIAPLRLSFEQFRITLVTLPPRPVVSRREAIVDVARHVEGSVDLTTPLNELLLVGMEGEWHFGRVVSRSRRDFREHEHKPQMFSSSLPARLARAMVNLVAAPGHTVVDPCCGSGSVLLEAWAIGARAVGADLNPKLAGMSQANLRHFRRPEWVCVADGAQFGARGDAIVTDLPYGRQSPRVRGLYERLLANFPPIAPRLAVVTASDIDGLLLGVGYEVERVACIRRGFLERRVYVAKVKRDAF